MAAPVLLHHPASLEHDTGMHPESAARIVAIQRELDRRDGAGWERREAERAPREALLRVHPERHLLGVEEIVLAGGGSIDMDTVVSEGSWEAALRSAGGAVEVVDLLLNGDAPAAASAQRPPGHHCEAARPMGFCLLNNVAIGARHALAAHGLSRVMIIDWDVHHGNGTNDIFHADSDVLFVSLHQWPLYPGTGGAEDIGSGLGLGHTVNLPLPPGSGDDAWVSHVEHVVRPLGAVYRPELILISAGYDAHRDDPLADCRVSDHGYAQMAASVRALGADVGAPVGLVLEGGYDVEALARSFADTLEVLGAPEAPAAPALACDPLAGQALRRVAELWPALAGV
ncbi:MAG: histone deacetylase [Solirubrobacteraceae bacterium]|nr:histone deacetylase [Solirubrobacteraceae bacterium]